VDTGHFEFSPDYAVPPGETLLEVLEEREMSQAELARRTDLSAKHINQIVKGHVPLSPDVALRLDRVTGVPARLWLNLEGKYRERLARSADTAVLESDLSMLDELPIQAMVKLGILTKYLNRVDRLREVLRFFGVANRQAWVERSDGLRASFRMSSAYESNLAAVSVWLRMGEIEAAAVRCAPWDPAAFRRVLEDVRSLTREKDPRVWQPEMERLCAGAGVAVVAVPEVTGARTNGAARWLTPYKGLIQLSIRGRWSDIFWFSFFHEARHILDQTKRSIFLSGRSPNASDERKADRFASDTLIPPRRAPELGRLRSLDEAETFARSIGVHPGIVVGRLQHERLWRHDQGNRLRQRLQFVDPEHR